MVTKNKRQTIGVEKVTELAFEIIDQRLKKSKKERDTLIARLDKLITKQGEKIEENKKSTVASISTSVKEETERIEQHIKKLDKSIETLSGKLGRIKEGFTVDEIREIVKIEED